MLAPISALPSAIHPKLRLRDVAEQVGVSIATARRVLTGSIPTSMEKRERVLAAARENGYFCGPANTRLDAAHSHRLGVVGTLQDGHLSADLLKTTAAPIRGLEQKLVESLVMRISCQAGGLRNAAANGPITIRPRMMRW